jgi:hypothetical protein
MRSEPLLKGITHRERGAPGTLRNLRVPVDPTAKLRALLPEKCRILCLSDRKAIDAPLPLDMALPVVHSVARVAHLMSTFVLW